MISLSQSAFLQALGWAIANSLWQMALLWGVYQLCFSVFRQVTASVKTTVATLCLFGGFIWFLSSLTNHYWQVRAGAPMPGILVYDAYYVAATVAQGHSFRFYINEFLGQAALYLPYLSFAYLLVLTFLLVRVVKAYRHVQQVRFEGLIKMDARWRVYIQELAHRIGISREVKVWLSEKIDIPATIGYLKPLILIPVASFNHLTPEQVEAILLHELAHIKRHDYLLNLVVTVVETILFFNPFAQLITRHIKTERENSCDDFVLQFRYNPHEYASALLSLEQRRRTPELAMMASGKTDLLDRIKRIMNVQTKPMNYGQKLFALLITAGILGSLAWLTPAPDNTSKTTARGNPAAPKPPAVPAMVMNIALKPPPKPVPAGARNAPCTLLEASQESRENKCKDKGTSSPAHSEQPASQSNYSININNEPGQSNETGQVSETGQDDAITLETDLHLPALMSDLSGGGAPTRLLKLTVRSKSNGRKTKTIPSELDPMSSVQQAFLTVAATIDGQMSQLKMAQFSSETQKSLDSVQRMLGKLVRERDELFRERDLALSKEKALPLSGVGQHQEWRRKMLTFKAFTLKKNGLTRTQIQVQADEDDKTGIEADQPGWPNTDQEDQGDTGPGAAIIPVTYISNKTIPDYKERITVHHANHSSIGDFLQKLAHYGILPEDKVLRINKDGNTLLINDKIQPKVIFSLFNACFKGESVVIIENGEVAQITIN
jgi:Zn-dependent protease with chaperone function